MKVKLGEVFENIINGDWGDEPTGNNDIAVIRTTNFTNDGIINYNNVVYRQIKNDAVLKKKLIYGDIIIEKSGGSDNFPVGRVVYYDRIDEIYLCNNFTSILRTNKELVVSKYLLYLMLNLYNKGVTTKFQNKTTGIRNLQLTSYLTNTEINIHDIQTQKEIVAVLDKVTSLISMRKEQLEKLDILVKSKFIEMFGDPVLNPKGWEKKKLGEVCSSIVRGPFGSALKKEYFVPYNAGVYKVYEQKNAIKQDSNIGSYYISEEKFLSLKRFECKTGDIIMSCSGTVGKMYTLPENAHQGIINQALMKMTLNGVVIDKIFKIYFGLAVENLVLNGSGIKNISSVSYLKNIDIQVPPLDLQNQFAEFVEQAEKNKENIKSNLNQLETLYSALMQEYFG